MWLITLQIIQVYQESPTPDSVSHISQMLSLVLSTPYFFFSPTADLTQTQQRLFLAPEEDLKKPLLERADQRFVFNLEMLKPLPSEAVRFAVPLVHGAVFINRKCAINGKNFGWYVISRRSRHRVGTRFFMRGCDEDGRVANFVETEQIVVEGSGGGVSSFVQTRGSMPMFWSQVPDIRYMPRSRMAQRDDHVDGFLAHFREQIPLYGDQVIVNLIDQKGMQGELEVNLRNVANEADLKQVHYVAFDFHKECAKMRYDKLSKLISALQGHISQFDYFYKNDADREGSIKMQKGVFRTNCMDCLDRTNVVQSLLATENLKVVLSRMGILRPGEDILKKESFQPVFKNVWADHADMISVQYSGTGALKTDFTRTGKRTRYGALQDGWNSAIRYYLNNFQDGDRTDALRYFVGEVGGEELLRARGAAAAESRGKNVAVQYLPSAIAIALLVLLYLFNILISDRSGVVLSAFVVCLAFTIALLEVTRRNGKALVNFPVTMNGMR